MKPSLDAGLNHQPIWPIVAWCLPALGGLVLFLASFPIDREIHFWPRLNLAELFALWFVFVAPIMIVIAVVAMIKRSRSGSATSFTKTLVWTAIITSIVANAFVLVGMWASTH